MTGSCSLSNIRLAALVSLVGSALAAGLPFVPVAGAQIAGGVAGQRDRRRAFRQPPGIEGRRIGEVHDQRVVAGTPLGPEDGGGGGVGGSGTGGGALGCGGG